MDGPLHPLLAVRSVSLQELGGVLPQIYLSSTSTALVLIEAAILRADFWL